MWPDNSCHCQTSQQAIRNRASDLATVSPSSMCVRCPKVRSGVRFISEIGNRVVFFNIHLADILLLCLSKPDSSCENKNITHHTFAQIRCDQICKARNSVQAVGSGHAALASFCALGSKTRLGI